MSGNTRHSPVRMSKQIYAEAESRTNLFVLPRREQYMWTQSKYTQKPRAMQEAEGKCKQVCMQPKVFCIAEALQYM